MKLEVNTIFQSMIMDEIQYDNKRCTFTTDI